MKVKTYHVFTDERDEWVNTLKQAKLIVNEWKEEGYINFRIYEETSEYNIDDEVQEDCIYSEGNFPW